MSLDGMFAWLKSTMKYKCLFAFFMHLITCLFHFKFAENALPKP